MLPTQRPVVILHDTHCTPHNLCAKCQEEENDFDDYIQLLNDNNSGRDYGDDEGDEEFEYFGRSHVVPTN